ncbi:polyprenyl synthetase family protein [Paenibacillus tarimensis]
MDSRAQYVERALKLSIPLSWDVPDKLREAMYYSLQAGGKRLRPVFVLAAAEAVRGEEAAAEAALPVACAVELIHTYSLIHDDLPAMDNDDYRRGKLTNHKVFGEAMAILAGDALLTHAFYCISQSVRNPYISAEIALAIIRDMSVYSGASGMVGGQAADIQGEQGITTLQELEYIHLHKTSDLIVFSLVSGGRVGGADPEQLEALALFGQKLGLAFQIQDDILDLIGDESKLGKKTNSDAERQKVTYPFLTGMEESKSLVKQLTGDAIERLKSARLANPDRLLELADYLMNRDH